MNAELQEWKHNPITKHVIKSLEEAAEAVSESVKKYSTIEETAINTIYADGYKEGISGFSQVIEALEAIDEN